MPWVRFLQDYDYRNGPRQLTAYKAGMRVLVSEDAAKAAVAAGKAEKIDRPDGAAPGVAPRRSGMTVSRTREQT